METIGAVSDRHQRIGVAGVRPVVGPDGCKEKGAPKCPSDSDGSVDHASADLRRRESPKRPRSAVPSKSTPAGSGTTLILACVMTDRGLGALPVPKRLGGGLMKDIVTKPTPATFCGAIGAQVRVPDVKLVTTGRAKGVTVVNPVPVPVLVAGPKTGERNASVAVITNESGPPKSRTGLKRIKSNTVAGAFGVTLMIGLPSIAGASCAVVTQRKSTQLLTVTDEFAVSIWKGMVAATEVPLTADVSSTAASSVFANLNIRVSPKRQQESGQPQQEAH